MATDLREPQAFGRARKGTGGDVPEIDDGMYAVTIKDVKQGTNTFDGETREQYVVEFEFEFETKPNGEPLTLRGYIAIPPGLVSDGVVNDKSNLYGFLTALGYTDDDLVVDPRAWQGQSLRVVVENREIKSGDNKGQTRPRITGYKKRARAAAAAAPAKRSAPPADEGEF